MYLHSVCYLFSAHSIIFTHIISHTLKFEAFHLGAKVHDQKIVFLVLIDGLSILKNAVYFLASTETTSKVEVLKQQVAAMSCVPVGQRVYDPDIMVRAFEYFATSRALYHRLKDDYKLPSIRTLTRITSKVSKIHDRTQFLV